MQVWCAVHPDGYDEDNRRIVATVLCDRTKKFNPRF